MPLLGRKRMSPLQQQNGAKPWGRMTLIRCSPFMPLTRFSGEHYRQQCDQIERGSVTILLGPSGSCPVLRCRSARQLIRVYENTAVNTGYYTFAYTKDGEPKTLPARYSIVFVKDGQNWMIVDHHSSAMPTPPRQ